MIRVFNSLKTKAAQTSLMYYFGNFFLNLLRYGFHLVLLRFLSPDEYGEFLSYLSLMYLLAVPTGTVNSLVTKFVANYQGKSDKRSINLFFYYLIKKTTPAAIVVGTALVILSQPMALLFKAHPLAFIILGISAYISLFQNIVGSLLLASQRYFTQTILGFLNIVFTILLSIAFIKTGFGAAGAVLGQLSAGLLITAITLYFVKSYIYPREKITAKTHFPLFGFTLFSFIYSLGTMSLISTDILIVRATLDTNSSGLYSSLSILGRMILFGLTPIIGLVLPMVSYRHASSKSTWSVFIKLGLGVLTLGVAGASIFSLFPEVVISLLSGIQYLSVSHLLGVFSFSMVLFAASQFVISYAMAIGKEKINYLLLVATIVQPIVTYLLSHDISTVVWINFAIHLCLLVSLFIYLFTQKLSRVKFTHGEQRQH